MRARHVPFFVYIVNRIRQCSPVRFLLKIKRRQGQLMMVSSARHRRGHSPEHPPTCHRSWRASRDGPARRMRHSCAACQHPDVSRALWNRRSPGVTASGAAGGRPCCGRRSRRRSGDLLAVTRRLVDAGLPPLPRLRPARHIQHLADRHHQPRRLVLPLRGLSVQGRRRLRQGGLQE